MILVNHWQKLCELLSTVETFLVLLCMVGLWVKRGKRNFFLLYIFIFWIRSVLTDFCCPHLASALHLDWLVVETQRGVGRCYHPICSGTVQVNTTLPDQEGVPCLFLQKISVKVMYYCLCRVLVWKRYKKAKK